VRHPRTSASRSGALSSPAPFMPLFTGVRGIGLLGSSYAETCIAPVLCGQKRPVAGWGYGPVQTPCNADGWICSVLDVVSIISDYSVLLHIKRSRKYADSR
jgi:hypothetical protein